MAEKRYVAEKRALQAPPEDLGDLSKWVAALVSECEAGNWRGATVSSHYSEFYGSVDIDWTLEYERQETEEEASKRAAQNAAKRILSKERWRINKELKDAHEAKEYARLKRKFEGKA